MKTLYTGGKILTMSEPLYARAQVEENGVVQAVGSQEALELQTSAEVNEYVDQLLNKIYSR